MRLSPALCGTAALALMLGIALTTTDAQAKHMMSKMKPAASAGLVAKGKTLMSTKRCDGCHSKDLSGKPRFSPSLHPGRPMSNYNATTFVRLMTKGLDEKGKPVEKPMDMACHQTPGDAKAMWAYLKTLKK